MEKPHIFISYTNTGAGHSTPAFAIAERIEELYPNKFQITTSNFFEDAGEIKFNRYIEKSWDFLLKVPVFTKILIVLGKLLYPIVPYYLYIIHNKVWRNSIKHIKNINPDIVFTTHFFTQGVAIDARKKYQLDYSIITLNPDTFETFPQWDRRSDLFLVCSELARQSAQQLKHNSDTIKIVPQAFRKEFNLYEKNDPMVLRKQYGLKPDVFTVFMSDGGQGIGRMKSSISHLIRMGIPLNIIAVCGKNKKLYKKLITLQQKLIQKNSPVQLLAFEFVEKMIPFIQMSDIFIGKSGPATILECLKLNLPVLINFSANPAERKTAQFFIRQKVALSCVTPSFIPQKITSLIQNPDILNQIKVNLKELNFFQDGSSIIANIIVDTLKNKEKTLVH